MIRSDRLLKIHRDKFVAFGNRAIRSRVYFKLFRYHEISREFNVFGSR